MSDYLVKLYDIPDYYPKALRLSQKNIVIRRPIGPENYAVIEWIKENFSSGWAGEAENAFFRMPKSLFIAIYEGEEKSEMLGFACFDATAKGFFGPIGVLEKARKQGIGEGLLLACLHAMKDEGYGYAIIGGAGPCDFYKKCCKAILIEDSDPGIYKGMLTDKQD